MLQSLDWIGSVAEWAKASFYRRLWSHDLGSTPTLVTLLRLWIRRFTMIISAWWLRTSSIFSEQEFEEIHRNIESIKTPQAGADFCNHEVVNAMKSVRIVLQLAYYVVRWQVDKYAPQQQQSNSQIH